MRRSVSSMGGGTGAEISGAGLLEAAAAEQQGVRQIGKAVRGAQARDALLDLVALLAVDHAEQVVAPVGRLRVRR